MARCVGSIPGPGRRGAAFGNIRANFSNDPVSGATEASWTVGAGGEVAFAPN
jgi:hypothetical protein